MWRRWTSSMGRKSTSDPKKKKKSSTVDRLVKTVVKIEDWGDGVGHVCYGLLYWIWRKERFVQLNEVLG